MDYVELVQKIRNKETIDASAVKITGMQLIMLFQDGEIKSFQMDDAVYEVNFIPVNADHHSDLIWNPIITINEKTCETFRQGCRIFNQFVEKYKKHERIFIHFEDEYFEVILEVLETK